MFKHSFSLSYIKTESEQVTSPCGTRQAWQPPGAAASLQNACFTLGTQRASLSSNHTELTAEPAARREVGWL